MQTPYTSLLCSALCAEDALKQAFKPAVPSERGAVTGELCSWTHSSLAQILALAVGVILPAPAAPTSTRISARLKRVQEHSSPVNIITIHESHDTVSHTPPPFDAVRALSPPL